MLLLGFAGGLRRSEIVALDCQRDQAGDRRDDPAENVAACRPYDGKTPRPPDRTGRPLATRNTNMA